MPKSTTVLLVKDANAIVGGQSNPSKMPGKATSLSPEACNVGSKLRKIPGSVCFDCYAFNGRYAFPVVKAAMARRLDALDHPLWVDAMVVLISRNKEPYFRWEDAGDLQSVEHLERIVEVVNRTPGVHHWLPTHEYGVIAKWRRNGGIIPSNLVIRESAVMVDGPPPVKSGLPTSTVVTDPAKRTCPAPDQNGQCGKCRQCWDPTVKNVAYGKH